MLSIGKRRFSFVRPVGNKSFVTCVFFGTILMISPKLRTMQTIILTVSFNNKPL